MDMTTAELLNDLRTASIGESSGSRIRLLADQLEAVFCTRSEEQTVIHTRMAMMGSELAAVNAELDECREKLSEAEEKVRYLIAQRFGRSRERWTDEDDVQAQLFPELERILAKESPEPPEEPEDAGATQREVSARRGKRKRLPPELKRVERILDIPEDKKQCPECGKTLEKIGEDVSERLQVIPEQFFVEATIRPRYACSCGSCGVKQAAVPEQVAPKSMVGETVAAQVVTGKFCDGLPFHRQARILANRFGVEISEQTIGRAAMAVARVLEPLAGMIQKELRKCLVVCGDETRLRVLHEDGKKKAGLSWMWVLVGEWEGRRLVRFRYDPGRGNDAGRALLAGYRGTVMADGYGVYSSLAKELHLRRAACLAHCRRKFLDVLKANPKNKDAQIALAIIGSLYQVERMYADATDEERFQGRQKHSRPIFEQFSAWLFQKAKQVRPKGLLGVAVNYSLNLLPYLEVYLEDGRVPIDNSRAEQAIRPFAVGRRVWLFNDQPHGAETSATLFSIIETVKANGLEPYHYLVFVLRCYERFGAQGMDWDSLFPRPEIREYAERIGVPWNL